MVFLSLLAFVSAGLIPDLVVVNARVRTMDARSTVAEALAVRDGRIAAVGSTREIRALAGPSTKVIDARGRLVLPGFNDAHVHFLSGGYQLANVDLRDAKTREEFSTRIAAFAARLPQGKWVLGGDWDHELWPGAPLPRRE